MPSQNAFVSECRLRMPSQNAFFSECLCLRMPLSQNNNHGNSASSCIRSEHIKFLLWGMLKGNVCNSSNARTEHNLKEGVHGTE